MKDTNFKMGDIGKKAADDIVAMLIDKRTMKNVEIDYLRALFRRAREYQNDNDGMQVHCIIIFIHFAQCSADDCSYGYRFEIALYHSPHE